MSDQQPVVRWVVWHPENWPWCGTFMGESEKEAWERAARGTTFIIPVTEDELRAAGWTCSRVVREENGDG